MADKKPQKIPLSKLVKTELVIPKYLVLHQSSPVQIANRYSSLGATVGMVKPTYQSALVTPINSLLTQSNQKTPSNIQYKTSEYFSKIPGHNLFYVESCYSHLKTPQILAKAYYPSCCHYVPVYPAKSIKFYRDILFETESI